MKRVKYIYYAIVNIFYRILQFLKLVDEKNNLALTNIAFYIFLYKIFITPMGEMTVNDLGIALSMVGLYFGKKIVNAVKAVKLNNAIPSVIHTLGQNIEQNVIDQLNVNEQTYSNNINNDEPPESKTDGL